MEEDGLLLNFAVPDSNVKHVEKATGGRWKDRRKMNLALQGRGRTSSKSKNQTGVNSIEIKKPKIDASKKDRDESQNTSIRQPQQSAHTKFLEARGEFGGKNNSYVSSLFTSNQESKLTETKEEDQQTYLPSNAPIKDAMTFEELGLNETLSSHLKNTLRFKTPTRVQRSAIPSLLLARSDLFIKAQTGSGKTLAFVLPIIHKLMQENTSKITRESGVFSMILAPTRELATQIYGVLETVTRCYHHIVPGIVIGGEKKKSEKARIRKGVNILVGTPGRLADHIENTEALDLSQLRYLILDEGDRLIELGFEETITKITEQITKCSKIHETSQKWQGLPKKRLNVLCSATMQNNVEKLGSLLLDNPEMISVDSKKTVDGAVDFDDDSHLTSSKGMSAPDQLVQKVVVVPSKLRLVTLNAILKQSAVERVMVFFSCSDSVNYHFDVFTRNGKGLTRAKNEETGKMEIQKATPTEDNTYPVMTSPLLGDNTVVYKLHGSMSQQERTSTLSMFVNDKSSNSVLFCTDVASRGLDLPKISEVIEYDPPFTIEDHLHRIGRTARVGNEGSAFLFLLPGLEEGYKDNKLALVHAKGSFRVEGYEELLKKGYGEVIEGKKTTKWDIHATTWHLNVERWLLEDSAMHDKACLAFTSHIRAYATHLASERNFFNVKLLHLGHLAKAFGLRDSPKKLGRGAGDHEEPNKKRKKLDPRQKMLKMAKMAVKATSSEFNY